MLQLHLSQASRSILHRADRLKADLQGGAGEGVHDTLGQRAGRRRFHQLLLLWSRQWAQNAH